jgi:hypothetical protein
VRGILEAGPIYHISDYSDPAWLILRCPNRLCELSFAVYDQINDYVREVFPYPDFRSSDFKKAVPEKVREDFAEGKRCYYAGAYKGAVTMFRRALQNLVVDQVEQKTIPEATKGLKLVKQIDALAEHGQITATLQKSAHEIRHFGNFGAHPQDDELDDTTREDADSIENLLENIIVAIYITPFNTERLRRKRNGEAEPDEADD